MSERLNTFGSITSRPFGFSAETFSIKARTGATLALVLLCIFISAAAVSHLPLAVAAAGFLLVVAIGCLKMGSRPFAVFGLVYSVPLSLVHHFVYRPNIGAADGLTIELIDVWMIWLLIHYASQVRKGNVKPIHGFTAFCVPLTLLLAADLFSLSHSADIELSVYGILNHIRAAELFIVLALTLGQGKRELRAVSLAIVCAVVTMGGICLGEMMFKTNITANHLVDQGNDSFFRAGGLDAPTLAAGYLAALLPLVAIEYFCPLSRPRKVLAGVGLSLGLAGLACTLTRAAIGILAIGSIPLLIYFCRHRVIRARHIILCFGALALLLASLGEKISARLDEGTENWNARVGLLGTALNMASNSPLVGEGINNYELKMHHFIPSDLRQKFEYVVHNKFLLTFAETGMLGLVAFVWLFAVASFRALMLARRGFPLGIGLLCSVIIVVLDMNVESYYGGTVLLNAWILIAVIAALWSSTWATTRQQVWKPPLTNVEIYDSSKS